MIRLGALGDVIRSFPAVAALRARHAGAHIAWLVEPRSAGAVALHPAPDELILFPRDEIETSLRSGRPDSALRAALRCVRELRARRFDLVVDLHSILKSGLLSWLSGARRRVGYGRPHARELAWLLASERVPLGERRLSRFDRNAALVEWLTGEPILPGLGRIEPPPQSRLSMAAALGERASGVVMHPGTSPGTPFKRWSPEGFAAVARALAGEPGVPCVVAWGPDAREHRLAEQVVAESKGAATLAPATVDFADLVALLAQARLFIGADSGPLHAASLVGTPVVQILGPTDAIHNEPWRDTPWRRVREPLPCSPCRRGCAAAICMRSVTPESVASAARDLLGEAAGFACAGRPELTS